MTDEHERQPPDQTRPLPPPGSGPPVSGLPGSGPAPWSGRAEVRPSYEPVEGDGSGYWTEPSELDGRRWWTPILLGIVALVLLGLLSAGVWLVLRSGEPAPPTGTPSGSTTGVPGTSAAPTSAAPSSAEPSPTPTTGDAKVPLPPLTGLPQAGARALLDRLGLGYRLRFEPSDRPVGTVIRTDPPAGTLVEQGDEIALVIAEEPAPPTGAPPSTAGPTSPPSTG